MRKIILLAGLCFNLCFAENTSQQAHQFHHPKAFVEQLKSEKKPGEKIYQAFCSNCHNPKPMISVGAPRFRESSDWLERLKQDKKDFFAHVDQGKGLMPARGGCFECSDKELWQAIDYMLPPKTGK